MKPLRILQKYFTSALRNIAKYKGYSLIHIFGLAIGLAIGIFVVHYARLEFDVDSFHEARERIYRVSTTRIKEGVPTTRFASTYSGAGPAMQAEFPEVEAYTRLFHIWRGGVVSYNGLQFRESGIYHIDSGFLQVFIPAGGRKPQRLVGTRHGLGGGGGRA